MYKITYKRINGTTFVRTFKTIGEIIKFEESHNSLCPINLKDELSPHQYEIYKSKTVMRMVKKAHVDTCLKTWDFSGVTVLREGEKLEYRYLTTGNLNVSTTYDKYSNNVFKTYYDLSSLTYRDPDPLTEWTVKTSDD